MGCSQSSDVSVASAGSVGLNAMLPIDNTHKITKLSIPQCDQNPISTDTKRITRTFGYDNEAIAKMEWNGSTLLLSSHDGRVLGCCKRIVGSKSSRFVMFRHGPVYCGQKPERVSGKQWYRYGTIESDGAVYLVEPRKSGSAAGPAFIIHSNSFMTVLLSWSLEEPLFEPQAHCEENKPHKLRRRSSDILRASWMQDKDGDGGWVNRVECRGMSDVGLVICAVAVWGLFDKQAQ